MGNKHHGLDEETFSYLADFFRRVFVVDPHRRMGFYDMINHPVFRREELASCPKDIILSTL
jgi:hypothetical protein